MTVLLWLRAASAEEPAAVRVEVGPALGARHFAYREGTGLALRDYDLAAAAGLATRAEAYPVPFPARSLQLGLGFGYFTTTGLSSDTSGGRNIETIWTRLDVDARLRWASSAATVALALGVAREAMGFSDKTTGLPSARYTALRVGLDARIALGPVALLASGGALPVLSLGGIAADQYRGGKALGFEGALGLGVPLRSNLEVALSATHTRYSAHWDAALDASRAATGSVDSFSRLRVTLAFSH